MSRKLLFPLLGLAYCLCTGCAVNPLTGEEELMFFPEQQDIAIGNRYAPEIEKQMGGRIDSRPLQNYINSVGQKLARVSHRPDFNYHFIALNHESTNAFALPGGRIFITRGMLEKLSTEAQLTGILSHEIAHVVARDTSAAMSRQIGISLLLSAVTSEKTPQTAMMVADLTNQIMGLRFSRQDEREADLAGVDYMAAAGYNPNGMIETMQMLQDEDKSRPIEFLSTHPAPENRAAYLRQKIQTRYYNLATLKIGREDYNRYVLALLKTLEPPGPANTGPRDPARATPIQHTSPKIGY